MKKSMVRHWKYDDGYHPLPADFTRKNSAATNTVFFNKEIVGWHCWFYPSDNTDVEAWMKQNMTGKYDCTFRFNSGDPMYTILITKDEDATLFKLTWM